MRAQSPQAQAGARMELQQPDLTAALRDIRTQYESIAVTNLQEAEEWYKAKVPMGTRGPTTTTCSLLMWG